MAQRLDTSSVTQEEVEALFTQHDLEKQPGDDESPADDEESGEEEEAGDEDEEEGNETESEEETEEEDEEDESEESDEDDEEEAPAQQLDWSKVDKRYSSAFEKAQAEAIKWERQHAKLQSQLTRESRSRQEEEATLTTLREKAQAADQWDALLAQHPHLEQILMQEVQKLRDPFSNVPDIVKQDPLFQQMQRMNQQLEQRLAAFEKSLTPVQDIQKERVEAQSRRTVDGLLGEARAKFKTMFGKDATEDDLKAALKYMVDNKDYAKGGGTRAVLEVFGDQWQKQVQQKRNQSLREKAKKFGARNKSLSAPRGKMSEDAKTPEEAIARALADQGYGT